MRKLDIYDSKKISYSSAFFRGQIEQPGKPILFDKMDNPVFIAVNTEGVFLIDMDDDVRILHVVVTGER